MSVSPVDPAGLVRLTHQQARQISQLRDRLARYAVTYDAARGAYQCAECARVSVTDPAAVPHASSCPLFPGPPTSDDDLERLR